jgi:hypothetical protein
MRSRVIGGSLAADRISDPRVHRRTLTLRGPASEETLALVEEVLLGDVRV